MHGMLLGRVVQQRGEAMAVLCQSMCVRVRVRVRVRVCVRACVRVRV